MRKPKFIQTAIVSLIGGCAFAAGYFVGATPDKTNLQNQIPEKTTADPVAIAEKKAPAEKEPLPSHPEPQSSPKPEGQNATGESGYTMASRNLEEALQTLDALQGQDRFRFAKSIFEYLAENHAPDLSLELANLQDPRTRNVALRSLVSIWGTSDAGYSSEQAQALANRISRTRGSQLGIEAELAGYLSGNSVSPSVKEAWIQAFSDHPGRSEIRARIVAGGNPDEIESALFAAQNWTDWEQRNFSESLLFQWTQRNPTQAWDWYQSNGDSLADSQSELILETWARQKPSSLIQNLDTLNLGNQRESAIRNLSRSLASRGTLNAMNWADSLTDPLERDLAYQAIYDATPKGIGAVVDSEAGFLRVDRIMPEGALRETDVQAGDLIVEARNSDGSSTSLYGKSLRDAIGTLRGPPGSQVEIRYLRRNPSTGQFEERTETVTRDLLVNEG